MRESSTDLIDLWPLFDALRKTPVLAVRGELSDLLSAETLAAMKDRHANLTAVTAPRVGHAPFLTEVPAWDSLKKFLIETAQVSPQ